MSAIVRSARVRSSTSARSVIDHPAQDDGRLILVRLGQRNPYDAAAIDEGDARIVAPHPKNVADEAGTAAAPRPRLVPVRRLDL